MNKELIELKEGLAAYNANPAFADAESVQKLIDYIDSLEKRLEHLEKNQLKIIKLGATDYILDKNNNKV